jgi:vancomycin resistance protein YoaR
MKIVLLAVAAPLVLIGLVAAAWAVDDWRTGDKVARNVTLAGVEVGGQSPDELGATVESLAQRLPSTSVRIEDGAAVLTSTADTLGISIDTAATTARVMRIGRSDPLVTRPVRWLRSLFGERESNVVIDVDAERLAGELERLQGDRRRDPVEPGIETTESGLRVIPGAPGSAITVQDVVEGIPGTLGDIDAAIVIPVTQTEIPPRLSDETVQALADEANAVTSGTISLVAGGRTYEVEGPRFRPGFVLTESQEGPALTLAPEPLQEVLDSAVVPPSNPTGVRFEIRNGVPVPVGGQDVQICCGEGAAERVGEALLSGRTTVELPTRTLTAEAGRTLAATLGVKEVVGSFTTYHQCCESRVTNIHRIADLTRGVLIPPGATFSVNDTVGRRTVEKGFVEGGVIINGEFGTDIGGGVSQYATTLFNAAFFGGLDIPAYKAHSKYISRYPFGREATLAYPSVDLKVRNNTPYGVVIWPTYSATSITVDLWSTSHARGEQTAQNKSEGCGLVLTERTRTFLDGKVTTDTFRANYDCD